MGEEAQFRVRRGSGRDHRTTSPQNRQDPPPPAIDLFTFHALPPWSARWRCPHYMNNCSGFKFAFLRGTSGRKESRFHGGTEVLYRARSYFGAALGRGSVIYIRGFYV